MTRLPAQARFCAPGEGRGVPLAERLAASREDGLKAVDVGGSVGNESRAEGRLVALACPPGVTARRIAALEKGARHRGRPVSAGPTEMCRWTVLLANVPGQRLSVGRAWEAYRLRWQVEPPFKRFESEGGLAETSSGKRYRVGSGWYVKLPGQAARNRARRRGGPPPDVNPARLGRVIADGLPRVAAAVHAGQGLFEALTELEAELKKVRDRTSRRERKSAACAFAQPLDQLILAA